MKETPNPTPASERRKPDCICIVCEQRKLAAFDDLVVALKRAKAELQHYGFHGTDEFIDAALRKAGHE